jgi:hypothetical protein
MEKQITAPSVPNKTPNFNPIIEEPKLAEIATKVELSEADRVPANWSITLVEDEVTTIINCRNNVSGATFTGTPKEFSVFIRG